VNVAEELIVWEPKPGGTIPYHARDTPKKKTFKHSDKNEITNYEPENWYVSIDPVV
jgi:hypothetical protein